MKNYMKQLLVAFLAVLMFAPIAAQAQASAWGSDGVHSSVMYTVRHAVTPMIGLFKKFDITVNWDAANPTASSIDAKLDASSVMMGMDKLEQHLQSADFFDVAKFPEWTFVSTSIVKGKKSKTSAVNYIANGKLTVHGVTKDIAVPFQFLEDEALSSEKSGPEFAIKSDRHLRPVGSAEKRVLLTGDLTAEL